MLIFYGTVQSAAREDKLGLCFFLWLGPLVALPSLLKSYIYDRRRGHHRCGR